jgi:hypothetical protein
MRLHYRCAFRIRGVSVGVEWAHLLAKGWASPVRGLMREHEYLRCLHFNSLRLPSGAVVNMSSSSCAGLARLSFISLSQFLSV